jgi:class 3 adenylate cyclase/tetratricopeptide (TPR) repeat protein
VLTCAACGFESPEGFRFCGKCGSSLAPASEAERRQLAVLFCDLIDSTRLSAALDPEDLRDVVRRYQQACGAVVEHFGGHVAQYLGDGLLIYFGFPKAQEDDTRRAVRAGLGMLAAMRELAAELDHQLPVPLAVRIGIHVGLTVTGDVGTSLKREQLAIGQTPNLAARVQGEASPNSLLITQPVHALVDGFFNIEFVGLRALKGFADPVGLYRVLSETSEQGRFDVSLSSGLLPLVNREAELERLMERAHLACSGSPQAVLLTGEPGIGKSRLLHELHNRLKGEYHPRWWAYSCSEDFQGTGLHPLTSLLTQIFDCGDEHSNDDKLAKLRRNTEKLGLDADVCAHLAVLLGIDAPESSAVQATAAALRRGRTLKAICAFVLATAHAEPLVLVLDDLQWADPSTRECLEALLESALATASAQLLLICASRPDGAPAFTGPIHREELRGLSQSEVQALIFNVAGGSHLPRELELDIAQRTDGVPLFVEELTKLVGAARSGSPQAPVPPTLQALLMARLDALGPARELAQFCAVLGRDFRYPMLRAANASLDLDETLSELVRRGVLAQTGTLPEATFRFRHGLLRDVAYDSLLKSQRRRFHQAVAEALDQSAAGVRAIHPQLLARHYTAAGLQARAVPFWLMAARTEAQRSNNQEAIRHVRAGLEALETAGLPDRASLEVGFYSLLGAAHIATEGYAAPAVREAYGRALAAAEAGASNAPPFLVLIGLWTYFVVRSELNEALRLARKLNELAHASDNPLCRISAAFASGFTHFFRGEFVAARAELERCVSISTDRVDFGTTSPTGDDHKIHALGTLSWLLVYMGKPDAALAYAQDAVKRARASDHPYGRVFAESMCAHCAEMLGDYAAARRHLQLALPFANKYGFSYWLAIDTFLLGSVQAGQLARSSAAIAVDPQQRTQAFDMMTSAYAGYTRSGARMSTTLMLSLIGEHAADHGDMQRLSQALEQIGQCLAETEERAWVCEYHRLRGRLHALRSQAGEAEAEFRRAMQLAEQQRAFGLMQRAALNLSQLYPADALTARRIVNSVQERIDELSASPDQDHDRQSG